MKGPGNSKRFVVRRGWQCPRCGLKEWTGGHVVNLICPNCGERSQISMRLIEDLPRPRKPTWLPPVIEAPPPEATQTPLPPS